MSGGGRLQMPGLQVAECPKPVVTITPLDAEPDENGDFNYEFSCDYPGPVRWFLPATDSYHYSAVVPDGTAVNNYSINESMGTSFEVFAVAEESVGVGNLTIP